MKWSIKGTPDEVFQALQDCRNERNNIHQSQLHLEN